MKIHDTIIIGSGAAGAWAAQGLKDRKPVLFDVGYEPRRKFQTSDPHLLEIKDDPKQSIPLLLGENYESLNNIFKDYVSPKFKAPYMDFLLKAPAEAKSITDSFASFQSFSRGGLANGWGAGCYRYQDHELKDFPFSAEDLAPYYKTLTQKIGISGQSDDLSPFYGTNEDLLPPIPISESLNFVYQKYLKHKDFFNEKNFFLGYPRLAYRKPSSNALDYYLSHNPDIYTPAFTIDDLIKNHNLDYRDGYWVESYIEKENCIELSVKNLKTGAKETHYAKTLVVALGAINSSAFILRSQHDHTTQLPILDNNISYVPFVAPSLLGRMTSKDFSFGSPMTIVLKDKSTQYQISFYNIGGVLLSDLLGNFPLSAQAQLICSKYLLPSMFIAQVFYPDKPNLKNYLHIDDLGAIRISYQDEVPRTIETTIIKLMRKVGLLSHSALIQTPQAGNSIHYAGMIPMRLNPTQRYECDSYGKLNGSNRVFIADSAGFPTLPAKNHTFTIMANALRIGEYIHNEHLKKLE